MKWRRRVQADTGGREAREHAEKQLEEVVDDLAETRAETPKYEALARDLRRIRQENHLAEAFLRAAGRDT